jgi:hypothetical protein
MWLAKDKKPDGQKAAKRNLKRILLPTMPGAKKSKKEGLWLA